MEEDILNYLYQLSCFVGHPVFKPFKELDINSNLFSKKKDTEIQFTIK